MGQALVTAAFKPWYGGLFKPWYGGLFKPWYDGLFKPWYDGLFKSWYDGLFKSGLAMSAPTSLIGAFPYSTEQPW